MFGAMRNLSEYLVGNCLLVLNFPQNLGCNIEQVRAVRSDCHCLYPSQMRKGNYTIGETTSSDRVRTQPSSICVILV